MTENPAADASISYNQIDQPSNISGVDNIDYLYTYGGEKLQAKRTHGEVSPSNDTIDVTTVRNYIGPMQFVNDTLERVIHA